LTEKREAPVWVGLAWEGGGRRGEEKGDDEFFLYKIRVKNIKRNEERVKI
jgi:hypothetical protein